MQMQMHLIGNRHILFSCQKIFCYSVEYEMKLWSYIDQMYLVTVNHMFAIHPSCQSITPPTFHLSASGHGCRQLLHLLTDLPNREGEKLWGRWRTLHTSWHKVFFWKKKTLPFAFVQKSGQNEIGLGDRISTTESGLSEFNQNWLSLVSFISLIISVN